MRTIISVNILPVIELQSGKPLYLFVSFNKRKRTHTEIIRLVKSETAVLSELLRGKNIPAPERKNTAYERHSCTFLPIFLFKYNTSFLFENRLAVFFCFSVIRKPECRYRYVFFRKYMGKKTYDIQLVFIIKRHKAF